MDPDDLNDELNTDTDTDSKEGAGTLSQEHQTLVDQLVAEKLKVMKNNVDKAYKTSEELKRENVKLKNEQQELKRKRLEDEGKHFEAAKLRIAELEEELKNRESRLTSLTRDRELEKVLGNLDFRNEYARSTAFTSIIPELVQDDDGTWVHKSGASLVDYVKTFAKDPVRDFLFKDKTNSGTGTSPGNKGAIKEVLPKTLVGLTTAELIALANSGKLGSVPPF